MSNGSRTPAPSTIRVHLQALRNLHAPVLRDGEERLHAAMAEYAASVLPSHECKGVSSLGGLRALNTPLQLQ